MFETTIQDSCAQQINELINKRKWVIAAVDFNKYVSIRVVFLREVDIVNETVMRSFFGRTNCAQRHLMVLVWFFSGQETLEQTAL